MAKYKCIICGHIYDEAIEGIPFSELPDSWTCPMCSVPKSMFELVPEENAKDTTENNTTATNNSSVSNASKRFKRAIDISASNPSIERIESKCIDCGLCALTCKEREGISDIQGGNACVYCRSMH